MGFLGLALVLSLEASHAQTRQIERYTYDAAGNVIGIEVQIVDGPPRITSIEPDRVFAGGARQFTISGVNLAGASVATAHPGLAVSGIQSGGEQIALTVAADSDAALGDAVLTIATPQGEDTASILVRPPLPLLSLHPAPIVVTPGGPDAVLQLTLDAPAAADRTLELTVADPALATVTPPNIVLTTGQSMIAQGPVVRALALGGTPFRIMTEGAVVFSTTIFAVPAHALGPGARQFLSPSLLLRKLRPASLRELGPLTASQRVLRGGTPTSPMASALLTAPALRVARGTVLTGVSPGMIERADSPSALTLLGFGLNNVDRVEIEPADGIIAGMPVPAADGLSVNVPLTIAPDAPTGLRRVLAQAAGSPVRPQTPGAASFYLAGGAPRIDSIDPIILNPGVSSTLTIRGARFSAGARLDAIPQDGIVIDDALEISPDQTMIRAQLHIAAGAMPGLRVIAVTTAAGSSGDAPVPANTLTISDTELVTHDVFATRMQKVFKGEPDAALLLSQWSPLLGIGRGALVTDVQPRSVEAGAEVTVQVSGQGLGAVTAVAIDPPDGVAVGALAKHGEQLEFTVAAALDAPRILRKLALVTANGPLPPARPELGTFRVTAPLPVVDGLDPAIVTPGDPAVTLTITGLNFEQNGAVRVIPQSDLSLGTFTVSMDGRRIMLPIQAAASAATGPRVVQVETAAGASTDQPAPGNVLHVGGQELLITPLLAPALGVERVPEMATMPREIYSALLGVTRPLPASPDVIQPVSSLVHVAKGPVLFGLSPGIVPRGFEGELLVTGAHLRDGLSATLNPGDGVTLNGPAVVSGDASSLTIPISVDTGAPVTSHRLQAQDATGAVRFLKPARCQLLVTGPLPLIQSIAPISALPDQQFTLVVRGINLTGATEVRMTPEQGINVGATPLVNADGTELMIDVDVSAAAEPGPRLVQVITPAGASGATADPANTLTIIEP